MNKLEHILVILLLAGMTSCQSKQVDKEPTTDLFNGKNMDGWVQKNGTARFRVEDGMIIGSTVMGSPNSFLCTEKEYGDFILELEVWVDPELNSGIQIRSHSLEEFKNGLVHGYQVEIDPSDRAWSGGIYDEGRRGWLDDLEGDEPARKAFNPGGWNHYRIEAIGPKIRTWVNGIATADLVDTVDASGFIGLQVHSHAKEGLEVKWRNLKIKDLDAGK